MFEIKKAKSSKFATYLDEKRKRIAIAGLNDAQYRTFQNEVLETLNAIKSLLDSTERTLCLKCNIDSFDVDAMKIEIYNNYLLSNNDSHYFRSIIDELIDKMDNYRYSDAGKEICNTRGYLELIKDIRRRVDKLKDDFFAYSVQKSSLLSVVSPKIDNPQTAESLENKYLLYQSLIDLTSEFSNSSDAFTIPASPEFLAHFCKNYKKMKADDEQRYHASEEGEINSIMKLVTDDIELVKFLEQTRSALLKIGDELKEYGRASKRLFKSKELKTLYKSVEEHVENYINKAHVKSNRLLEKYENATNNQSYIDFKELINFACREIDYDRSRYLQRIDDTIDLNFSRLSDSMRFVSADNRHCLPYMGEQRLDKVITNARLLELFFQAYREVPGISLTNEELIELIKKNKKSIRKFITRLLDAIEEYVEKEDELDNNNDLILAYYDCIKNNRILTEQEVIDHTIKKCLASPQKVNNHN